MKLEKYKSLKDCSYESTKDVQIEKINCVRLVDFRGVSDQIIEIGDKITVIAGKNGTMKSTMLGLIAHPFSSPNDATDILGNSLKTSLSNVFRLSPKTDNNRYSYEMYLTTTEKEKISQKIRVWYSDNKGKGRFRIYVGEQNTKNSGNFLLNTCYVNLKRLFPIIDTKASENDSVILDDDDRRFIFEQYQTILQNTSFQESKIISESNVKNTLGPSNTYYDFNTISSGEDNLGHLIIKLLAFKNNRVKDLGKSNGVLCIDELEASLHPVAQEKLFNVLYNFSKKYNVQVVFTTHSLYLIQHILEQQQKKQDGDISINILSTQFVSTGKFRVIHNPDYKTAYKELTYKDNDSSALYKPNIILEDKVAGEFFKKIIKNRLILNNVNLITDLSDSEKGNSYTYLKTLLKKGPLLLEDSIIIFDADVDINEIKSKIPFFKFVDSDNYPIEKRIVKWIYDLDGSHPFFEKMNKEKSSFIADFDLYELNFLNSQVKVKEYPTKKFKEWSENENTIFKKCITQYINFEAEQFEEFKRCIINAINEKRRNKSLSEL